MEEGRRKRYVGVMVVFGADGAITPLSIDLDGVTWGIDKVLSRRRMSSTRIGGSGERYGIVVRGRQTFLYSERTYDGTVRWYVEERARS